MFCVDSCYKDSIEDIVVVNESFFRTGRNEQQLSAYFTNLNNSKVKIEKKNSFLVIVLEHNFVMNNVLTNIFMNKF